METLINRLISCKCSTCTCMFFIFCFFSPLLIIKHSFTLFIYSIDTILFIFYAYTCVFTCNELKLVSFGLCIYKGCSFKVKLHV